MGCGAARLRWHCHSGPLLYSPSSVLAAARVPARPARSLGDTGEEALPGNIFYHTLPMGL